MNKFNTLIFIDDDTPTNVYHRIIVEEANLCESSNFFNSPIQALDYFKMLTLEEIPQIPDVIFLDINMPRMDGWEFLDAFKQINLPSLPIVIMLTTSLLPQDVQRAEDEKIIYMTVQKPLTVEIVSTLHRELSVKV